MKTSAIILLVLFFSGVIAQKAPMKDVAQKVQCAVVDSKTRNPCSSESMVIQHIPQGTMRVSPLDPILLGKNYFKVLRVGTFPVYDTRRERPISQIMLYNYHGWYTQQIRFDREGNIIENEVYFTFPRSPVMLHPRSIVAY